MAGVSNFGGKKAAPFGKGGKRRAAKAAVKAMKSKGKPADLSFAVPRRFRRPAGTKPPKPPVQGDLNRAGRIAKPRAASALAAFQRKHGLNVTGSINHATRKLARQLDAKGDSNHHILASSIHAIAQHHGMAAGQKIEHFDRKRARIQRSLRGSVVGGQARGSMAGGRPRGAMLSNEADLAHGPYRFKHGWIPLRSGEGVSKPDAAFEKYVAGSHPAEASHSVKAGLAAKGIVTQLEGKSKLTENEKARLAAARRLLAHVREQSIRDGAKVSLSNEG